MWEKVTELRDSTEGTKKQLRRDSAIDLAGSNCGPSQHGRRRLWASHLSSLGLILTIFTMQKEILLAPRVLLALLILWLYWKVVSESDFLDSITRSIWPVFDTEAEPDFLPFPNQAHTLHLPPLLTPFLLSGIFCLSVFTHWLLPNFTDYLS